MAETGTDPESKIWRLTGSGVLVFGAGFGVNFSDFAHLWYPPTSNHSNDSRAIGTLLKLF